MRRVLLAVVSVAALALAVAAPAGAKSDNRNVAADRAQAAAAERQAILDYWTAERRANAKPRDIVLPLGSKPRPTVKPGGGGGGGTSSPSANSKGATWNFGGDVSRTTGKVFFTLGGSNYVCSGSLIAGGTSGYVVSTAGHCTHEGDGSGADGYASRFTFYPAWTGSTTTSTAYTAVSGGLYATDNWEREGAANNAYPDDAAFVKVTGPQFTAATLPRAEFTDTMSGQMYAFGYPAAQKYKGNTLTYCSGAVAYGYYDRDDTISMPCNMTGGSSGGPWFKNWNSTSLSGVQASVNSYGYSGITRMWGPVFDGPEQQAFNEAAAHAVP